MLLECSPPPPGRAEAKLQAAAFCQGLPEAVQDFLQLRYWVVVEGAIEDFQE